MQERRVEECAGGLRMEGVIDRLSLWMDEEARDGPSNMAVDEWLLESSDVPILRVYRWAENWGSYGYFVPDAEAKLALKGLFRVRRWTGGGIVDHRADWTYTLVLPRGEALAEMRGAESYRLIHQALAEALVAGGVECRVAGSRIASPGGECFKKAVEFDLLGSTDGRKIAGAGQRRTSRGLLHQGSLASGADEALGMRLAESLAKDVMLAKLSPDEEQLRAILSQKYATEAWATRR